MNIFAIEMSILFFQYKFHCTLISVSTRRLFLLKICLVVHQTNFLAFKKSSATWNDIKNFVVILVWGIENWELFLVENILRELNRTAISLK
jgi:hypothetical protein